MFQDTTNPITTIPTQPVLTPNQEIVKEWIKALRSGEYKQCYEIFHKEDKYCALGVLQVITNDQNITDKLSGILFDEIIERNDDRKDSFKQIANYIEEIVDTIEIFEQDIMY